MSMDKHCLFCQQTLPVTMRDYARYCSDRCRVRAYRKRRNSSASPEDRAPSFDSNLSEDVQRSAAELPPERRTRSLPAAVLVLLQRVEAQHASFQQWYAEAQRQSEQRMATQHAEFERKITTLLAQFVAAIGNAPVASRIQNSPRPEQTDIASLHRGTSVIPSAETGTTSGTPRSYWESYAFMVNESVNSSDSVERQQLQAAIDQGYNPAVDTLAFAKLEELQAIDRLTQWQMERSLPLTVKPIPLNQDREYLAAIGALQERRRYHNQTPPPQRRGSVAWRHPGWRLDAKSEQDLLRRVYERIARKLQIPSGEPFLGSF